MDDLTVVVATYGDQEWTELAWRRAVPSAAQQARVIRAHAGTLAEARNRGLARVQTERVVHLDADDELEPGYVEALSRGSADLRAPAVRYVRNGREARPRIPRVAGHRHACSAECLTDGNWLVVGTAARTELLREVGGWHEWPLYEDYDLFLRCWLAGASVEAIPEAVYRAHTRPDSRNLAPEISFRRRIQEEIVRANFPLEPVAA